MIVREFSVPASFTVGEHDNVVSSVFAHERDDPDHVIFQRLVDGAWTGCHVRRGRRPDPFGRTGFDRRGRAARRPGRDVVGDPLRVADPRLRDPGRRRASPCRSTRRLGRAGAVRAARTPARCWCSPRPTRTRDKVEQLARRAARAAQGAAHRRRRGTPALDALAEAGAVGRRRRTRRPAGRHQVRRSGDADLHLGHHRPAQGLPAHPLQPALRDPRRQGLLPDAAGQGRAAAGVPAAGARAGPRDHRSRRSRNKVTLGFTSDIKNLVPTFAVFKPTLVVSVPRVFEKVYNTAEQNARNDGKGKIFDDRRRHRDRVERGAGHRRPGPAAAGQARGVRPAGVRQAARRARRRLPRARSPAARRWAPGSATSTAASA